LLRASVFNLERLDILRDSIGQPCRNLLSFEYATNFRIQFGASQYITGVNRTSEYKVIVVLNCSELLFSVSSVLIYYGNQSDIRVKTYCRSNLLRASFFNLMRLDILRHSVGHPSKNLLSSEFSKRFRFQFVVCRYITGLNQTSVYKVIVFSICSELLVSILSVSIYYPIQSDIRLKRYCRLNFLRASVCNLERLDILLDSTEHPCIKLLSIQFAESFGTEF